MMTLKQLRSLLIQLNFNPQKNLGQNFLIDKNLRDKIISFSEISINDIVLEVGPGFGALTEEILKTAKKVYAVEKDKKLFSYCKDNLSVYNNLELIHGDILEIDLPKHNKFISNIPYSITGPIVEKIMLRELPPVSIFTLDEKIANRIFSGGSYKDISRITIGVNSFMVPAKKDTISKNSFFPRPKINLSLIKLVPKENLDPFITNDRTKKLFLRFIAAIMPYKNKNLANAIYLGLKTFTTLEHSKQEITNILYENDINNSKVFEVQVIDFIELSKKFLE